jgi:hypothetical protein
LFIKETVVAITCGKDVETIIYFLDLERLSYGKRLYDTVELPGSTPMPAVELQAGSIKRDNEGKLIINTKDRDGNPISI